MSRPPLICSISPDARGRGNKTEMSEGCIKGSDCLNTLPLRGGHNGITSKLPTHTVFTLCDD
jgi:hypothetical protein